MKSIFLFFMMLCSGLVAAQSGAITNTRCTKGDCRNSFSTLEYTENGTPYRYIGEFQDGKFHGYGVIYDLDRRSRLARIPKVIGRFREGEVHKRSLEPIPQFYGSMDPYFSYRKDGEYFTTEEKNSVGNYKSVMRFRSGEKSTRQIYLVYDYSDGQTIIIDKPFVTAFGTCISGDCENGQGTLRLDGIGDFSSARDFPFSNGVAQFAGYLTLTTGEVLKVGLDGGIPSSFVTVKLPPHKSRLAAAKRRVWKLPPYSCLEGDCRNGFGKQLFGPSDRFVEDELNENGMVGYYEGQFENGVKTNGTLHTFDGRMLKGDFSAYALHGTYTMTDENGKVGQCHFLNNKRVTADGKPYEEEVITQMPPPRKKSNTSTITKTEPARTWTPYQMKPVGPLTNSGRSQMCPVCAGSGKEIILDKIVQETYTTFSENESHYYKTTKTEDVKYHRKVKCYRCKGKGTINN